ncbi:DUF2721 domain-containing protein [Solimonas marina]|uniref:DUF2721 domain-containing protein n=1 Tax=Solimonas marina TaxID=2714601 RepID=A0A970B5A8_9GAMM|nr:DUF2721 domain-containing protein [Solimonas marina]NKF23212.1 DUF2721 domain-containing protein [Solimonas marina]
MPDTQVAEIAHTIQVAVAPVFLLGGVSAMLGVLTSRLGRIIDHARRLEGQYVTAPDERLPGLRIALRNQARRANLTSYAIGFCIGCALLIASVIVVLFVGTFARWNLSIPIGVLFVASITSLICGLMCFLREIQLATQHLRIGELEPDRVRPGAPVSHRGEAGKG